jgi:methyl-accepting chemotaxis protein
MQNTKHSLMAKLIALSGAGVFLIILFLSIVFIRELRSNSLESAQRFIVESTRHLRDQMVEQLQQRAFLLDFTGMNSLSLIKQAGDSEEDRLALQNYYEEMAKTLPNVLSFFGSSPGLWNAPGNFFVSSDGWRPPPDYDNRIRSWFTAGKAGAGRIVLTDPYLDMVTKTITVALTKTVFDQQGTPVMVLAEDISVNTLNEMANAQAAIPDIKSYLIHPSGRYISNPDPAAVMEKDFFTDHDLEEFRLQITGDQSFFGTNGKMFICSEPVSLGNWNLVSIIPLKAVFDDVHRVTRNTLISASFTLLVFGILFALGMRKMIAPIKTVANQLKDISEGEGDLTKQIVVSSKDEIGNLTKSFNRTLEKIKNMIISIKNQTQTLSEIGAELTVNMSQTAQGIQVITNTMHTMKTKVMSQSSGVSESRTRMEQILRMIDLLNGHVDAQGVKVRHSSEEIEGIIGNIQGVTETLNKNTASLKNLTQASEVGRTGLQEVSMDLREITRESEGLLEINGVMESIASQTNLLSMNAAIEAAHAGEAGKGFAVVADEIRKLAESSSEQSKTIVGILSRIKDAIDKITASTEGALTNFEAIDLGVKTVSEQAETIRNAMNSQNARGRRIVEAIGALEESARTVKNETAEMLDTSREILSGSHTLTQVTEQIAQEMNEIASAVDQINVSVTRVNTISGETKENIDILTEGISLFKVD